MVFLTNIDLIHAAEKYGIPLVCVFSKDQPPSSLTDGGYIVNLEDSHDHNGRKLGGSHWTAFGLKMVNSIF
jgi:hypothetical protein